jgi:hypothetical protein
MPIVSFLGISAGDKITEVDLCEWFDCDIYVKLILPTRPQFAMILHLFKSMRASTTMEPTIGLFLLNEMTANLSAQTLPQSQIVKCKGRIPHENEGFACSLSL